ncbi:MAG: DUF2723 domain-containing protein [Chloroflexota bacterium]|nr:DUF2723 domain-containing protein [Chloroflexota bacterium]
MTNPQSPIPNPQSPFSTLRSPLSILHSPLSQPCLFAFLLVIYLLTLAPTITWAHHGADGGDLVVAVAQGGIPHPPGFPTYLLLGELFVRLPWGDMAWRLNLMSAVLAAGAATLTAATVGLWLQSPTSTLQPPLCAGLTLGLAPLFWSQALITEVYAPAAFFTALLVILALRGGPAWALGLVWGVGMGVHPTLLFLAPLVAWGAWKRSCLSGRTRFLVQVGLLAILGWGVMYGPVLLARGGVDSPWGEVSTLEGWWALVSGRIYHGYLFGLPLADWPRRLLAWLGLLARQFTPVGAVLAGLGLVHLWREWRAFAVASVLTFGAFSLYAISYNTADSLVYLVLALPLAGLWLGSGLAQAAGWLGHRLWQGAWLILLLPLLQLLLFWGQMDLSSDREAMDWAERVLQAAPPQAVLLTAQDGHTFALWYVQDVLGERPDVAVVDVDLWAQGPYRRMMEETLNLDAAGGDLPAEAAAYRTGRPVMETSQNDQ